MKTLYLVRHAKSSWKEPGLSDFDRPLNNRGILNAPFMGKLLSRMGVHPDLLIASSAKRTLNTAELFAAELGYKAEVVQKSELYLADLLSIADIIKNVSDRVNSLMLFCHNPGITDLSNFLSGEFIANIPTAGVVKLELNSGSWKDTKEKSFTFKWFEYPKKYTG